MKRKNLTLEDIDILRTDGCAGFERNYCPQCGADFEIWVEKAEDHPEWPPEILPLGDDELKPGDPCSVICPSGCVMFDATVREGRVS